MPFLRLLGAWIRRDFRVRYTQTLFGSLWMLVQPLALTATFTFLFNGVTNVEVGVPYVAFVYTGMLLWAVVSTGLMMATQSVAATMYIASKAKYPRIVAPLSATVLSVADLSLGLLALPLIIAWNGAHLQLRPSLLLGALAGTLLLVSGLGALLSALAIFVRDIKNGLPFLLQVALLLTPIAYARDDVPDALAAVAAWNPVGVFVEAWRAGFMAMAPPTASEWVRALLVTGCLALAGFSYFHAVEDRFPDVA